MIVRDPPRTTRRAVGYSAELSRRGSCTTATASAACGSSVNHADGEVELPDVPADDLPIGPWNGIHLLDLLHGDVRGRPDRHGSLGSHGGGERE